MTSVYCVIRSVTHVVDGDQVLHRIHLSEAVKPLVDREGDSSVLISRRFITHTCLPILGVAANS